MPSAKRRAISLRWAAAIVAATPLLMRLAFWVAHRASYAGVCGPHAPDISAHPCTYNDYMAEFGAGFAGVGLLMVEASSFLVAIVLVAVVNAIAGIRSGR
jgi:hypothetical protein